jgi:thiol-disulfide isomerase/thioredoxin
VTPVTRRTGLSKGELAAVAVVVVLAVIAVVLLWPGMTGQRSSSPADRSTGPTAAAPAPWSDEGLEAARRAAGLPACPVGTAAAPAGPLAGVRVPCLGAPGEVEPASGLAGHDALINIWGSWCAPCRTELPALSEYANRPGAIPVLGVDERDRPDAALALLADLGVRLPVVADPDGALAAALRVPPALPASYLLRADGTVTMVLPPTPFKSADEVAAAVARLRTGGS